MGICRAPPQISTRLRKWNPVCASPGCAQNKQKQQYAGPQIVELESVAARGENHRNGSRRPDVGQGAHKCRGSKQDCSGKKPTCGRWRKCRSRPIHALIGWCARSSADCCAGSMSNCAVREHRRDSWNFSSGLVRTAACRRKRHPPQCSYARASSGVGELQHHDTSEIRLCVVIGWQFRR